jgi:hypothetical protein
MRTLTKEQTDIINEQLSRAQAVHIEQDGSIIIKEGNEIKPLGNCIGSYIFLRYLKPSDFEAEFAKTLSLREENYKTALLQFCTEKIQKLESLTKEQSESISPLLNSAKYVLIEHDGKITIKDHMNCFICIYKKKDFDLKEVKNLVDNGDLERLATEFSHIQIIKDLPDLLKSLIKQINQQDIRIKGLEGQLYLLGGG